MSLQSAKHFENIIMYLSILRYIFKSRSKKGLYDLNKQAESFFKDILNIVFDWNLKNLNSIKKNHPAIDLGDSKEKICVQVTAQNGSDKIEETISKVIGAGLHNTYTRLVICIITDKKNYTKEFKNNNKLKFDAEKDIMDIDDILDHVESLSSKKIEKLHNFLKEELRPIVSMLVSSDSLLANVEQRIDLPPENGKKFLESIDYQKSDMKKGIENLKRFYEELVALPKKTRECLYMIVFHGKPRRNIYLTSIGIQPKKLENFLCLPYQEVKEELDILNEAQFVTYVDDEPPHIFVASWVMDTGVELFSELKKYSKDEKGLANLIINCDFSSLDE